MGPIIFVKMITGPRLQKEMFRVNHVVIQCAHQGYLSKIMNTKERLCTQFITVQ